MNMLCYVAIKDFYTQTANWTDDGWTRTKHINRDEHVHVFLGQLFFFANAKIVTLFLIAGVITLEMISE